jgi:hypothetical protein
MPGRFDVVAPVDNPPYRPIPSLKLSPLSPLIDLDSYGMVTSVLT